MGSKICSGVLLMFIINSFHCFGAKAETAGSIFFIDSLTHKYLRARSPQDAVESNSISLWEVGATVSVLLGVAPPATLSAAGSSKLNEVLAPNPFDRPRAAFVVEVKGVEDPTPLLDSDLFGGAHRKIVLASDRANIQLPEEVSVVSLDESSSLDSHSVSPDDISKFASWMGGSYVNDGLGALDGELTLPLDRDAMIKLYMSKKADREFTSRLVSLVRNIRRAIEMHEDFSESTSKPAELIKGSFEGIKILQEEYGSDGVTEQGVRLLHAVLVNIYDTLQAAYNGRIVGAVFFSSASSSESDSLIDVITTSQQLTRRLEEEKAAPSDVDIETLLVRRTLAWLTGLILLISTLLGIYFLLNMPLTRDTLLYSNVKLD